MEMKVEEIEPEISPTSKAKVKVKIELLPKINSANTGKIVVIVEEIVLVKLILKVVLTKLYNSCLFSG